METQTPNSNRPPNLTPGQGARPSHEPSAASAATRDDYRSSDGLWARMLESPYFWIVFVALAFGIPVYRSVMLPKKTPLPVLATLPNFTLKNQDNQDVSLSTFRGSVLVVNFIFTTCPNTCPLLTQQMKKIGDRVSSAHTNVHLLSISVDPQTDTPAVLKAYGEKYHSNFKQWSFLTGPLEDIQKVVINGFKMAMDQNTSDAGTDAKTNPSANRASPELTKNSSNAASLSAAPDVSTLMDITHGEHFVIVDQIGQIRAYTRADNSDQINDIVRKVAILMNTNPPRPASAR